MAMGRVLVLLRAAPIFSHQFLTPINYTEQRARCCLPCFCAQRGGGCVLLCARSFSSLSLSLPIYQPRKISVSQDGARSQPAAFSSKSSLSLHEMICMPCECRQLTPSSILRSLNHQGGLSGKERKREKCSRWKHTRREEKNSPPLATRSHSPLSHQILREIDLHYS